MKTIDKPIRIQERSMPRLAAFTLTELLVIICMIALLAGVMATSYSQTSSQAKSFQCLANMHRLTAAWRSYSAENSDKLVRNNEGGGTDSGLWVDNNWLDWTTATVNTNQAALQASPLAPYLHSDVTVFKCPADTYLSRNQQSLNWTARIRSVSMNAFVGARSTTESPRNDFYSSYRQWIKLAEIPTPADFFVFADEHPDSINGPVLLNNPGTTGPWIDIPGSLHNGGTNLSFADEHVETHRWQSYSTKLPVIFTYIPPPPDPLGVDYQWLRARTAILYQ